MQDLLSASTSIMRICVLKNWSSHDRSQWDYSYQVYKISYKLYAVSMNFIPGDETVPVIVDLWSAYGTFGGLKYPLVYFVVVNVCVHK